MPLCRASSAHMEMPGCETPARSGDLQNGWVSRGYSFSSLVKSEKKEGGKERKWLERTARMLSERRVVNWTGGIWPRKYFLLPHASIANHVKRVTFRQSCHMVRRGSLRRILNPTRRNSGTQRLSDSWCPGARPPSLRPGTGAKPGAKIRRRWG